MGRSCRSDPPELCCAARMAASSSIAPDGLITTMKAASDRYPGSSRIGMDASTWDSRQRSALLAATMMLSLPPMLEYVGAHPATRFAL